MSLVREIHQGRYELVALALLLGAQKVLRQFPAEAAEGLVDALCNGEVWQARKGIPRSRRRGPTPDNSTPRP